MKLLLGILWAGVLNLLAEPIIIHEWGTFTVLQDEKGQPVGGINIDDEPVPNFVHQTASLILGPPARFFAKRIIKCHPDVTMRLETPIVYFYPPDKDLITLDFDVEFPGGWLTEFYPKALAVAPKTEDIFILQYKRLKSNSRGRLSWKALQIGGNIPGPETKAILWTAPRAVDASSVTTPEGESEKYLFYRGVGHVNASLCIVRKDNDLYVKSTEPDGVPTQAWLACFVDGTCAFRKFILNRDSGTTHLAKVSAEFVNSEFSSDNSLRLRAELRRKLIAEGLFSKEADAMLNTWNESYFQRSGTRIFYLVPRSWCDRHLPVKVSVDATITRVMVGRIEIITPQQRRLLRKLALDNEPLGDGPPEEYFALGRFADALLLDELSRRPTPQLRTLANCCGALP